MDPLMGIMSLGGGILNNLFAGDRQAQQEQFAAQQVQQQEQFQQNMRATAYQTAVSDMKAAGLNPMMAAGINTSVPAGAAATTSAAPVSDIVGPALSTAMSAAKVKQELEIMELQKGNLVQDNYIKQNQVGKLAAETANLVKEGPGVEARSNIAKNLVETTTNNAIQAQNERPYLKSAIAGYVQPFNRGIQDIYSMMGPLMGMIGKGAGAARDLSFSNRWP